MLIYKIRSFVGDRRGAVGMMAASAAVLLLSVGALAVDIGSFYYHKRRLQSAADMAALSAAGDMPRHLKAAQAAADAHGYDGPAANDVQTGLYRPDAAVPVAQRFNPTAAQPHNSVRVTLRDRQPSFFGRFYLQQQQIAEARANPNGLAAADGGVTLIARATAMRSALASFAIGTTLLDVQPALLNSILGPLLGTNLSLTLVDYQALASAQVDLFAFSSALHTNLRLTGVTYDQMLDTQARMSEVLSALAVALNQTSSLNSVAAGLVNGLAQAAGGSLDTLKLGSLLSLGAYGGMAVGDRPQLGVTASALDMLSAALQIANGKHQIETEVGLAVPGIAGAKLRLAIGELPQGKSWFTVGDVGASVHTAQVRLLLTVSLTAAAPLAKVELPIYIEVAPGTARLTATQCSDDPARRSATLGVKPGIVDAWIGAVGKNEFENFTAAPNPGAATLASLLGLANVTGRAHAGIANLSETPVAFTGADIASQTKKFTSTTDYLAPLVLSLIGDLDIKVRALGLGLGLPLGLDKTVANVLAAAVTPIDRLLSSVLGTLGISLGRATTWVTGLRCDRAVLVN